MRLQSINRQHIIRILLLCILLLSAYLRLYRIDEYLTFLGDEGRDVLRVKQMIVDGDMIFIGPTASVGGFFLGPMYYYFMAPFLWLFGLDPVGPAVMVALFGIATVYLVYKIGSTVYHPIVGVSASALYALSPLVISYSRSSWNPNIVPFFALVLFFWMWKISIKSSNRDYFIIGVICGLGIQFHYLFSFVILSSAVWMAFQIPIRQWLKSFVLVAMGSAISLSPFILFELKHRFPNLTSMLRFIRAGNETGYSSDTFFSTIADVIFRSTGRLLFRMPNYELWNGFPEWFIQSTVVAIKTTLLIGVLLLISLIASRLKQKGAFLFRGLEERFQLSVAQWKGVILLVLWYFIPVLLFGLYRKGIYDYYFGIFYAVPFFVVGIILWQTTRSRIGVIIAGLCFFALAYYNWEGRPFVYPANRQLEQTKNVARAVLSLAEGKPFNFAFITATNSDHAYRYFFEIWGNSPKPIVNTEIDPRRESVTGQLIVMCENHDCQPLGNPLWEVAGFGRAEIVNKVDVFPVRLYKLIPFTEAATSSAKKL